MENFLVNSVIQRKFCQKNLFIILCFALGTIVGIGQLYSISILRIFLLVVISVFFVFCKEQFFMPILLFLLPFELWIPLNYILFISATIYITRFYKHVKFYWKPIVLILLLILIEDINLLDGMSSLFIFFKTAILYLCFSFFLLLKTKNEDPKLGLWSYILGFIIESIIIIMLLLQNTTLNYILQSRLGNGKMASYLSAGTIIPVENHLGLQAAIVIMILLLLFRKTVDYHNLIIVTLLFSVLIGSLTKSRTFFILLLLNICFCLWDAKKSVGSFVKISSLLVGFLGIFLIFLLKYPQYFLSLIRRFTLEDISNGRIEIFKVINEAFLKKLKWIFFGVGTQNYAQKLNIPFNLHNSLQAIYVYYGFLGFLIMCLFFIVTIYIVKKQTKITRVPLIFYAPFLIFLIGTQTTSFYSIFILPTIYAIRLSEETA